MSKNTILFLCPHGGAKSVAAAAYFNRLVEETGLDYVGVAAAAEDPYAAVPGPMADLLEREGFDVRAFQPRQAEPGDLDGATKVVSIGCELANSSLSKMQIEQWDDVPQASEDLEGSTAAIRRHVDALAEDLYEEWRGRR